MKKVTELAEKRFRTTYTKDKSGNRVRGRQEYYAFRSVRSLGAGLRFVHLLVDGFIINLVYGLISYIYLQFFLSTDTSVNTMLTVNFFFGYSNLILLLAYYLVFETYYQQTIGKMITGSVVINEYAKKPSFQEILLRTVIRYVPFDALSFLFSDNAIGWHDQWSKTYVVSKEELRTLKKLISEQSKDSNESLENSFVGDEI